MTTTYATDDDVRKRDANAETRICRDTDIIDGTATKTFERFRALARDRIDAALAQRSPSVNGRVGDVNLRDAEVYFALSHGYRESASSASREDLFLRNSEDFKALAIEALESFSGADEDGDEYADPGSIGGSIPFYRS